MTALHPLPRSRHWLRNASGHGGFLWLPKGARYKVCGYVPSFGKDDAIAGRTRLATHFLSRAEIMRTFGTAH